jgi:hypothetical protein
MICSSGLLILRSRTSERKVLDLRQSFQVIVSKILNRQRGRLGGFAGSGEGSAGMAEVAWSGSAATRSPQVRRDGISGIDDTFQTMSTRLSR